MHVDQCFPEKDCLNKVFKHGTTCRIHFSQTQAIIYKGSESSWKMWYLSGKAACPHYAAVLKK